MLMNQYGGLKGVQEISGLINLLNPIGIASVVLFVVGVWVPFRKQTINKVLGALGAIGIVVSEVYQFFTWHVMTITGEVSIQHSIDLAFPEFYVGLVISLAMVAVYLSSIRRMREEHVKAAMNYKKPVFWIILLAVIACIVIVICLLSNPAAEREFPINGNNVSDLDTERVVDAIVKAEGLEDASQLYANGDNFDLMFTPDFKWANDGAIRFVYTKKQKAYSAQLRMFHDENKFFITDSSKWVQQDPRVKLAHYLDAFKYMPQEEIRQLSPDADGYSVFMRQYDTTEDYERIVQYSQDGVGDHGGWRIHLEVQPLHKVEGGGYNGSGDEVIHVFYHYLDDEMNFD